MHILIYGHNGWIGQQFLEYIKDIKYTCGKERLDNDDDIKHEVIQVNPTHIISFTGRTHGENINTIDYLEQPGKLVENIRDNLFGPIVLAGIAKELNIHYTYIGTGCIFNGYDEMYTENSRPDFFGSSYSIVKGFTDRLMHTNYNNTLNLRIRMPINATNHPRNFITKIVSYEKICSMPNSMTVLPDVFPVIVELMKKKQVGTVNLVNPGSIEHNEILAMYKEIIDPNFTWKNFSVEEQDKVLLSKRSNNVLKTNQDLNIPDIKTSIRNILLTMKNNANKISEESSK